jgi:DNA-binding beta-propeller fold protein YncE
MSYGEGEYKYKVMEKWAKLPGLMRFIEGAGVAVDSHDHVYVFCRSKNPVMFFDSEGNFLDTWGGNLFIRPHCVHVGPKGYVYCVDDEAHVVMKFSPKGRLIMTLGTHGKPSYTGFFGTSFAYQDGMIVKRAGEPFNLPTKAVVSPTGEIYVSDGYGNSRVHKFSNDGELLLSWGEPGSEPGQFRLPHGLCIGGDNVYVADRVNSCVHVFTQEGEFITDWMDAQNPNDAALGDDGNLYIGERGRITIRTLEGEVLARIGGEDKANRISCHSLDVDSKGNIYVAGRASGIIKLVRNNER